MFVRSSDRNRAQRAKIRKDWRREETREDWAEQREFVWWPTALVLSLCAEWKEAPAWVCCIFVCVCVCVNLRSSAGGSAPSRPYWWWMQSRQHQAKANDYKASSVTAAQAAPGEWPCTATQPHPATIHHNAFRRERANRKCKRSTRHGPSIQKKPQTIFMLISHNLIAALISAFSSCLIVDTAASSLEPLAI